MNEFLPNNPPDRYGENFFVNSSPVTGDCPYEIKRVEYLMSEEENVKKLLKIPHRYQLLCQTTLFENDTSKAWGIVTEYPSIRISSDNPEHLLELFKKFFGVLGVSILPMYTYYIVDVIDMKVVKVITKEDIDWSISHYG